MSFQHPVSIPATHPKNSKQIEVFIKEPIYQKKIDGYAKENYIDDPNSLMIRSEASTKIELAVVFGLLNYKPFHCC